MCILSAMASQIFYCPSCKWPKSQHTQLSVVFSSASNELDALSHTVYDGVRKCSTPSMCRWLAVIISSPFCVSQALQVMLWALLTTQLQGLSEFTDQVPSGSSELSEKFTRVH